MNKYLPGIIYAALLTGIAFGLNALAPLKLISPLLFAIILGMLVRNLGLVPHNANTGLTFSAKKILRVGVVLLGLRLSLPEVIGLGWAPIVIIVVTVSCVYGASLWIGRLLSVSHATTVLTSTGTAICGASAIAGMSAVVRPKNDDEKVDSAAATAIACITIFGTLAMFIIPALAGALHLNDKQAGIWLGASIHEVGQVVAAGGFMGQDVVTYATVTKLGRVVLLAPLVALVGYWENKAAGAAKHSDQKKAPLLPLFVVGFLIMVLLRSVLDWSNLGTDVEGVLDAVNLLANILLTLSMAGMGAGINFKSVLKTGARGLILGIIASLIAAGVSLILVLILL